MKLLVTGGCGFLGSNIANAALARGDRVCILDDLSRTGGRQNLEWLQRQHRGLDFVHGDVSNAPVVLGLVKSFQPDAVFHLAGQVAMTTSIRDPYRDFQVNALGTLNVLEALRLHAPGAALVYSSTNKVYGDLERHHYAEEATRYVCPARPEGFDEGEPLSFHSPYGCSKGAADQYCLDYARIYGLRTVVLRHSSMYGGHQFATEDQGWIGWFCAEAVRATQTGLLKTTISGTGKQVRDILHADDACRLYFACLDNLAGMAGHAYNVGGGMPNSLSLIELLTRLTTSTGVAVEVERLPARSSDQKIFVSNNHAVTAATGWKPLVTADAGLSMMIEWTRQSQFR